MEEKNMEEINMEQTTEDGNGKKKKKKLLFCWRQH